VAGWFKAQAGSWGPAKDRQIPGAKLRWTEIASLASGAQSELKLPSSGTVDLSCPDSRSDRCVVFTTSWIEPTTLWDYDGQTDAFRKSIFNTDVKYPGFDQLTTEEVEVKSHDGALVPLSIIRRKDVKLDRRNSVIVEGYGAYGISNFATQYAFMLWQTGHPEFQPRE
jgi:protease II